MSKQDKRIHPSQSIYKAKQHSILSAHSKSKRTTSRKNLTDFDANSVTTIPLSTFQSSFQDNHDNQISKNDTTKGNHFLENKNFIQTIADVSLMMANISQLRAVLGIGDDNTYFDVLLTLITLSIVSHIIFVLLTVWRSHCEKQHRIAVYQASINEISDGVVKYCCFFSENGRPRLYKENDMCPCPHCHTDLWLRNVCYILVFITIACNIGITGIGIS